MTTISHVGFSRAGGAGEVMMRLCDAQALDGWDSRAFPIIDTNLRNEPLSLPRHTLAATIDNWIMRTPKFPSPISLVRERVGISLASLPPQSDLIHLHWITGVISIAEIKRQFPRSRLVWTLHDMNAITGTCHQSLGCERFMIGCTSCPAVRPFARASVEKTFARKKEQVNSAGLVLVVPTQWLAKMVRSSPITGQQRIEVIPNPLSPEFVTKPTNIIQNKSAQTIVSLIARDLEDPLKGVDEAVAAHQQSLMGRTSVALRLIGKGGHKWASAENVTYVGELTQRELKLEYASSDYVIQPSYAESFGLTLVEAASQGASPIVRAGGAMEETLDLLNTGFSFTTISELAQIFDQIAPDRAPSASFRQQLSRRAIERYGVKTISRRYDAIYESLGIKK